MPTAWCLLGKRIAEYPRVVRFNQVDPFQRDTIPMEWKYNQLCGMDQYPLAMLSHIVAKDKFLDLASFRAAQTIAMCS